MTSRENLKKRILNDKEKEKILEHVYKNYNEDDDSTDDELPYGGKAFLARKKKGDSWPCILLQVYIYLK
jgi:hypothetical protein